jgi:phage shock protein PspC (stress-responsive transcriptional regulator)
MPTRPRSYPAGPESEAPDDQSATGLARAAGGLPEPRLWRSRSNRVIAGVIGGLAEKFGWEPFPARLLYALLTIASGGLLAIPYVGIWAITRAHGAARPGRRLSRSRSNKVIAGVLGGLAEKLDVSPTFLRVLYVIVSVCTAAFPGILIYLVLWAAMPEIGASGEED